MREVTVVWNKSAFRMYHFSQSSYFYCRAMEGNAPTSKKEKKEEEEVTS